MHKEVERQKIISREGNILRYTGTSGMVSFYCYCIIVDNSTKWNSKK